MAVYALIENAIVKQLFETGSDISTMFHPDLLWVEASKTTSVGQGYLEGGFHDIEVKVVKPSREELEVLKLKALADPLTGSDWLFLQAYAMECEDDRNNDDVLVDLKIKAVNRRKEILALYKNLEGA